jgi:hypothetical protein
MMKEQLIEGIDIVIDSEAREILGDLISENNALGSYSEAIKSMHYVLKGAMKKTNSQNELLTKIKNDCFKALL